MVSKVRNDVSCCGKDCQPVSWKMDFYKIDIDISKEIAEYIGIEIVPTFVVYRDGKICGYTTGVLPEETLEERIREMLRK